MKQILSLNVGGFLPQLVDGRRPIGDNSLSAGDTAACAKLDCERECACDSGEAAHHPLGAQEKRANEPG
jgi:hypothetical protein